MEAGTNTLMDAAVPRPRPKEVSLATTLFWISLGAGVINLALQFDYLKTQASPAFIAGVGIVTIAVTALLIYFISTGHNWARITFLLLFLAGAIAGIPELLATFDRSVLSGLVSLAQWILQIAGLYLVFLGPGAKWFARSPAA
jgi:hypothetical protein